MLNCDKCSGVLSILYDYDDVAEHISRISLQSRRGVSQERFIELLSRYPKLFSLDSKMLFALPQEMLGAPFQRFQRRRVC